MLFVFVGLVFLARNILKDPPLHYLTLRLFSLCEYTILALFFYNVFRSKLVRNIVRFSIIPFGLYAILDYIFNDTKSFNNHSHIISCLLLILFIVYYFYEKMNAVAIYPLYQSIIFWICVGLFLYFAGSFFFFIFTTTKADREFSILMDIIYGFVVILKNVILSVSLFASENSEGSDDALHIPIDLDLDELSLTNPKNL